MSFSNLKLFSGFAVIAFCLVVRAGAVDNHPGAPRRVISLSPNLTEIIYDIGAQDQLVGVTDFCKFPPEAQRKEKVGGWINPNVEKIVSLKPDLILTPKFFGKNEETFKKLRLPAVVLQWNTVEDVLKLYDVIGEKLGKEKQAQKAKARLEKKLAEIRSKRNPGAPLSVLFVVGHSPGTLQEIYGVGPHNFVDELIRWVGGTNILEGSAVPYPLVSKEALVRKDPDVIIDALPKSETKPEDFKKGLAVWRQMPGLKAVRENHVYCFDNEDFLIPGPTLVKLADYLSKVFQEARPRP